MGLNDILIRIGAVSTAAAVFNDTAAAAQGMNNSIAQGAQAANDSMKSAADAGDKLKDKIEGVRNAGAAVAAAGAVGLAISDSFINAGLEADRLGGKLSTLMKGAGLEQGIDKVKELGTEIAGLTGGDDDALGKEIAQAITTGRVRGLAEYGIVFDATANSAIKAAGGITTAAGKQEMFNQVMRLGAQAVATMRANTSDAGAELGQLNVRIGNLQEGIGMGMAKAKAQILGGLLDPILSVMEASPGLQTSAGYFAYIGSGALAAGGTVVSLGAQVGMMTMAFPQMAATASAAFATANTAALPLLLTVGKIALVALAAAAAMYLVDKALHAKEDAELQANIQAGEGKDDETLAILNKSRAKRGLAPLQKYSGGTGTTDDPSDPTAQMAKIQAMMENGGAGTAGGAPSAVPSIQTGTSLVPVTAHPDSDGSNVAQPPASASGTDLLNAFKGAGRGAGGLFNLSSFPSATKASGGKTATSKATGDSGATEGTPTFRVPVQAKSSSRTATGDLRIIVEGMLVIPASRVERAMGAV